MPIKPENAKRYPANWPEIRQAAGDLAGWNCQHPECVAHQYEFGFWKLHADGDAHWQRWGRGDTYRESRQAAAELYDSRGDIGEKPIVIVLTCAHLDHQPENCDPANLRMLCQRHHLAHDHQHHQANAQATRRTRLKTPELF